ncbi:ATP-binding cassette domain-containing protein [Actibacterium sp. XHP0104]|uniref:ATP-binding cassette domain-containing protein n=1 Tax=Actibacterium sp. XHP0104 TaxID=2984335 RepID=UPI0021E79623|nr:ATP-binding cassette domain-containing protein [Actibacterium sp. XHP0104]MCV2881886.1 ATP-binding cassette domain-containing protein [Actibacterium sp. XHP0104]
MKTNKKNMMAGLKLHKIVNRTATAREAKFKFDSGETLSTRRFLPLGKGDEVRTDGTRLEVLAKQDNSWIRIDVPWKAQSKVLVGAREVDITLKEVETAEELSQFSELKNFHYRGGGGAGRVVPLIATSEVWDLPPTLGFIEISSSMIANSARRVFFNAPFWDETGITWNTWDRAASKAYSNTICRISRFVIHPEVRGLGLARPLICAAREYSAKQWHYGGFRPRFIEITADMLNYYPFVDEDFFLMGKTEGNEHRLSKDMNYLVRKALSAEGVKAMPQGGGGVMTMQRGYASTLLKHMQSGERSFDDVISSLKYDPAELDQETWEALYRLNRRPKPCYISGLTPKAKKYVSDRFQVIGFTKSKELNPSSESKTVIEFSDLSASVKTPMSQSTRARTVQDAFGFVGADFEAEIVKPFSLEVPRGGISLVCGASGSGKTLLLEAMKSSSSLEREFSVDGTSVHLTGDLKGSVQVDTMAEIDNERCPLDHVKSSDVEAFIRVAASCGLAEPQLFVRPVSGLSSGQKYRLQLALTMLSKPQVVLIDNFCEALDQYTTHAVCKGLRNLAASRNTAVVVATAAYERLLPMLKQKQTILLRRGSAPQVRQNSRLDAE